MSRDLIETGLGWQYRSERIRQLIDEPETVTLVARDGERMIGFAIMTFGEERAHLVLLAVRPACQRRGIARRLMQWLLASASTAGIATIHVELRAENEAAYALYRTLGFVESLTAPWLLSRTRDGRTHDADVARDPHDRTAMASAAAPCVSVESPAWPRSGWGKHPRQPIAGARRILA